MVFFAILSGYESVRIPVHGWFRCGPEALPVGSGGFVNQLGPGWKWKKLILVGDKLINYLSSGPRSTIAYGKNVYYKSFSPHSQLISRHCLNCFKRKKRLGKSIGKNLHYRLTNLSHPTHNLLSSSSTASVMSSSHPSLRPGPQVKGKKSKREQSFTPQCAPALLKTAMQIFWHKNGQVNGVKVISISMCFLFGLHLFSHTPKNI